MSNGPRRVVTGLTDDGRSRIAQDTVPDARTVRPGGATITEIWRVDELPAPLDDERPLVASSVDSLAAQGLAMRICTFPPDAELDTDTRRNYAESVAQSYGSAGNSSTEPGALHRTDTVDILTVISGELHLVTEDGETLLRQGDSVVQRGTLHAWINRGTDIAVVAAVMIAAQPTEP